MSKIDKRVFDIRASVRGEERECVVAMSADATLLDLFLALLAALDWDGDFPAQERAYRVILGGKTFTGGRGSRTSLRRLLAVGQSFTVRAEDPPLSLDCQTVNTYEVMSRRHHPKVIELGGGEGEAKKATWRAQDAVRREYRQDRRVHVRTFPFIHGFLSALVSGPMVLPSRWLPELAGMSLFADLEEAKGGISRIMELHNAVARGIREKPDAYIAETSLLLGGEDRTAMLDWNRGFVHAMALAGDEWLGATKDPEMHKLFEPIAAMVEIGSKAEKRAWLDDIELRKNLARAQGTAAVGLAHCWRERLFPSGPVRRTEAKISPNAPCPCGSGKKYKRCCSPLRAV